MSLPALLDATPLSNAHAERGIGAYVRGLLDGFSTLGEQERPELLVEFGAEVPPGFQLRRCLTPPWPKTRIPNPWPRIVMSRRARSHGGVVHATRPELVPDANTLIVTCYDLIPLRLPADYLAGPRRRPQRKAMERLVAAIRDAAFVIVPTQETADDVSLLAGVRPSRVRVIPLGIPDAAPPSGSVPGRPYVLFGGGVEPHKNATLMIDALARTSTDLGLVLTGPWSPGRGGRLRAQAEQLGIADRVEFAGYVSPARLSALRQGAVAVAVPSLVEGFGLPVLEAMRDGVPVLAADIPSLREVGGSAAEYIPVDDPEPWAAWMTALAEHGGDRTALGAAGRIRAGEFSWRATAEQTRAVYLEAGAR
jgi:glycosyltransferase involved in cell wall biosynthesis